MPTFNLVREPWIYCAEPSGRVVSVGLAELLRRSDELVEIVDESPLVIAALYRLVITILHRNLGPRNTTDWKELWAGRKLPDECLAAYWERWGHRFDLFDEEFPFFQTSSISLEDEPRSVATLVFHVSSGNNATLVDHTVDERPLALSPAAAARALIAHQAFALAGTVGYLRTCERDTDKAAKDGPAARGALCVVKGSCLFETLVLNLVACEIRGTRQDRPAWEQPAKSGKGERRPKGRLDLFTWQSRRIRLFPEALGAGGVIVRRVKITPGYHTPELWNPFLHESMQSFVVRGDARAGERSWYQFRVDEDKAVWRDCGCLLFGMRAGTREWRPPLVVGWVARLVKAKILKAEHPIRIEVIGIATKQQKVLMWRRDQFAISAGVCGSPACHELLHASLRLGGSVAHALRMSVEKLASEILAPTLHVGGGRSDPGRVQQMAASFGSETEYWAFLGLPFERLLAALSDAELHDREFQGAARRSAVEEWAGQVIEAARRAFGNACDGVTRIGRAIRASTIARNELERRLRAIEKGLDHATHEANTK